jgi:outer membrane receptor for ferrienterochelin and colicins
MCTGKASIAELTGPGNGIMRIILVMVLILGSTTYSAAGGQGSVRGVVRSVHTGEPLPFTNIVLKDTSEGAMADSNGVFTFTGLAAGEYSVEISHVGYLPVNIVVVVDPRVTTNLEFNLKENIFLTDEVVVTAMRKRALMEDVPVTTELIRRQEILEKGSETLVDILQNRPGINIDSGPSGEEFIYLNGVDSKRILVLEDNLPVSGKVYDRIPLARIDSDMIERVEIVKGPASAIYGSEAMGGVVNIITREHADGSLISASGRTGSNEMYSGTITLSGESYGLCYFLSGDHFKEGARKVVNDIEIQETRSSRYSGKLSADAGMLGSVEIKGTYKEDNQDSEILFMGSLNENESEVEFVNSSLTWDGKQTSWLESTISAFYSENERRYGSRPPNSGEPLDFDTTTESLIGLRSDFTLAVQEKITANWGIDLSSNDYDNDRLASEKRRRQTGTFLQVETEPAEYLMLMAGARYDWYSDTESFLSPRIGGLYRATDRLKLRASWGKGFRAPSFIEMFSDFPMPTPGPEMRVVGNPDLRPESSEGLSIGVEYLFGDVLLLNTSYFHNRFEDMIVDYQLEPLTFSYLNVERAVFRGVELQSRVYITDNLTTTASYSYNDIDKDDGVAISTISPHMGLLSINYRLFSGLLGISFREEFVGKRDILVVTGHSGDLTTVNKDGYTLMDLTISYDPSGFLTLRTGARNLTDYTDEDYGPYRGLSFFFSAEARLETGGSL